MGGEEFSPDFFKFSKGIGPIIVKQQLLKQLPANSGHVSELEGVTPGYKNTDSAPGPPLWGRG